MRYSISGYGAGVVKFSAAPAPCLMWCVTLTSGRHPVIVLKSRSSVSLGWRTQICHVEQGELLEGLQKRLRHPLCSSSCFLPESPHPPIPLLLFPVSGSKRLLELQFPYSLSTSGDIYLENIMWYFQTVKALRVFCFSLASITEYIQSVLSKQWLNEWVSAAYSLYHQFVLRVNLFRIHKSLWTIYWYLCFCSTEMTNMFVCI